MIRATARCVPHARCQISCDGSDRDTDSPLRNGCGHRLRRFRRKDLRGTANWLTVSDFLWARFQRELGLKAEATPVLAVIATTSCEAERLPWSELG